VDGGALILKVAILTNFEKSKSEYSLYNVVLAQAAALAEQGNTITVFVNSNYVQTQPLPTEFGEFNISVRRDVPLPPLRVDYQTERALPIDVLTYTDTLANWLKYTLPEFDTVFTHDWVFTGWNLPYFLALEKAAPTLRRVKFLHWIHTMPGKGRDWWNLRRLGEENHRLVFPNNVTRARVAFFYQTDPSKVFVIPHIVDLRDLFDWQPASLLFARNHPEIMSSHVVQIYPAGSDRLDHKGIRELILIFAKIKPRGFSVFLVVANQHADGNQEKIDHFIRLGSIKGLIYGEDFVFTSEENTAFREGVPRKVLRDLMQCSSTFVFPTQQESFGLVLPETSLASGALPVLNSSLTEMMEIGGNNGLLTPFGSYCVDWNPNNEEHYLDAVAGAIISQTRAEEALKTRVYFRRRLNRETIYQRYYVPILEGSNLW
jgi:Glycosyltransferase Family 4